MRYPCSSCRTLQTLLTDQFASCQPQLALFIFTSRQLRSVIPATAEQCNRLRQMLTPLEYNRIGRMSDEPAQRWLNTRATLRLILATFLHCAPKQVPLYAGRYGKLYLPRSPLFFNLSHSGYWTIVAVANRYLGNVGIDLEWLGRWRSKTYLKAAQIVIRHLQRQGIALPPNLRTMPIDIKNGHTDANYTQLTNLTQYWTTYEGLVKYYGTSLWYHYHSHWSNNNNTKTDDNLETELLLDLAQPPLPTYHFHLGTDYVGTLVTQQALITSNSTNQPAAFSLRWVNSNRHDLQLTAQPFKFKLD